MLREIIAAFGVEVDAKALDTLGGRLEGAKKGLAAFGQAVAAGFAVHKLHSFIEEQIEVGSILDDTSARLGVTTDALQRFQFAASQAAGVGAEEAANALGFLNKNLGAAIQGNKEAAETFAGLGIDLESVKDGTANAATLLPALAEKFSGLGSDAERTALAMKLFGKQGAALLPMLKGGRAGAEGLSKQFDALGGGLDDGFIRAADDAGDATDRLRFVFRGIKAQIAMAVLPGFTQLVGKLTSLAVKARVFVKETNIVNEVLAGLAVVGGIKTAGALLSLGKALGVVQGSAGGTLVSLLKFGLPLILITALGLLFEDLYVLMKGGDSVIGDFITKTFGIEKTNELVAALRQGWDAMSQAFASMGPTLKDIGTSLLDLGIKAIPYIIKAFVMLTAQIAGAAALLTAFIDSLIKLPHAIKTGDFSGIGKSIDRAGNAIFGKTVGMVDPSTGKVTTHQEGGLMNFANGSALDFSKAAPPMAPTLPIGPPPPPSKVEQNNAINMNIHTNGDPAAVGRAAADGVRRGLDQGADLKAAFAATPGG